MAELNYTVKVNSGDPENDAKYCLELFKIFSGVTEGIKSFGYTDDECICTSDFKPTGYDDDGEKRFDANLEVQHIIEDHGTREIE
jgi:hypothetical protein